MSELQDYYNDFCSGYWTDPDPKKCRCGGTGYAYSEVDTVHQCPIHFKGQRHPEAWDEGCCGYCGEMHADGSCKMCEVPTVIIEESPPEREVPSKPHVCDDIPF